MKDLSFNKKLNFILKELITLLKPKNIELTKHSDSLSNSLKKRHHYQIITCEVNTVLFEKDFFKDFFNQFRVNISDDYITIKGNTFKYYFPTNQILTIQNRIKKLK